MPTYFIGDEAPQKIIRERPYSEMTVDERLILWTELRGNLDRLDDWTDLHLVMAFNSELPAEHSERIF